MPRKTSVSAPGITPRAPVMRATYSPSEAATYIGICRQHLYKLRARGELRPSFYLGRKPLYRIVDLDAWMAARTVEHRGGDDAA